MRGQLKRLSLISKHNYILWHFYFSFDSIWSRSLWFNQAGLVLAMVSDCIVVFLVMVVLNGIGVPVVLFSVFTCSEFCAEKFKKCLLKFLSEWSIDYDIHTTTQSVSKNRKTNECIALILENTPYTVCNIA